MERKSLSRRKGMRSGAQAESLALDRSRSIHGNGMRKVRVRVQMRVTWWWLNFLQMRSNITSCNGGVGAEDLRGGDDGGECRTYGNTIGLLVST